MVLQCAARQPLTAAELTLVMILPTSKTEAFKKAITGVAAQAHVLETSRPLIGNAAHPPAHYDSMIVPLMKVALLVHVSSIRRDQHGCQIK